MGNRTDEKEFEIRSQKEVFSDYQKLLIALETADEISNYLAMLDNIATTDELNMLMPKLLNSLGHYALSDRVSVYTWTSSDRKILHRTYEWCAKDIPPVMRKMRNLQLCDMPNWIPVLHAGETVTSENWEAEEGKYQEERTFLKDQDVQSLMLIPILTDKNLKGFIWFDNPKQKQSVISIPFLRAVSGHIGGLRDKIYTMEGLEKKEFLRRMNHYIRTQINGIQGVVSIADCFPNNVEKQKECREKVRKASSQLLEMINNVLPVETVKPEKLKDQKDISLKGFHVLIAEDNELNMEITEFILKSRGMCITRAWNGTEAAELFAGSDEGTYDLILMDVVMPFMNGLEATRMIRCMERKDAKTIPIFAMTANAFREDMKMSRDAGMNEHIAKPIDEKRLIETIQRYLIKKI